MQFLKRPFKKIYFFFIKIFFETLYGSIRPIEDQSDGKFDLIKIKFSENAYKEYEIYFQIARKS